MKYLLDASALLPLVTKRGKQLIVEASRESLATTDLALYEACNSLWKLTALLKHIPIEDAVDIATMVKDLALRNVIRSVDFTELDFSDTLNRACKEKLTFYDASYIITAERTETTLVSENEKLLKAARKSVKAITYSELEDVLTQRKPND